MKNLLTWLIRINQFFLIFDNNIIKIVKRCCLNLFLFTIIYIENALIIKMLFQYNFVKTQKNIL